MNPPKLAHNQKAMWSLEALRGLAAWMVVYAHYASFAGIDIPMLRFAYTGVDLFFVLSGFLFAPYLLGRKLIPVVFAIRRVFRIYPAYLASLLIYASLKSLSGLPVVYFWEHLIFFHLQFREMAFFYNPAYWSLPAEVEFYLFLPLMAKLISGQPIRFAVLLVLAIMMRVALGYFGDTTLQNTAYVAMHHLPGMLVEFLFGGVAWHLSQRGKNGKILLLLSCLGVTGWLLLADVFAKLGNEGINATWVRNQTSWLAALSFALMLPGTALVSKAILPEPLMNASIWAGRLSYGTYLLHFAALMFVTEYLQPAEPVAAVLIACVLTLGCSWMLYHFLENPWREFGRSMADRVSAKHSEY